MRHSLVLGVLALTLAACSGSKEQATYNLSGQVISEAGAPVGGATVSYPGQKIAADANGTFDIKVDQATAANVNLGVAADGFASRAVHLTLTEDKPAAVKLVLRPSAAPTSVTMPAAGAAPATVTATQAGSTSVLTLAAGSLVNAQGTVVVGKVDVRMNYWSPAEAMVSAPGSLVATDTDGSRKPLNSLGMAEITAEQDGHPLQVAPGASLGWQVTLPASAKDMLAANTGILARTALFALDPNTGTFIQAKAFGPDLTYDADAGVLASSLPHLSTWNYDYICDTGAYGCNTTSNGGCVQGMAYDCSGTPLANYEVQLWAMGRSNRNTAGYDGVIRFKAVTDSTGHYCTTIGVEYGYTAMDLVIHVSGSEDAYESNRTCPLDKPCATCTAAYPYCSGCANGTVSGVPSSYGISYTVSNNLFCPNAGCTQLDDLYVGPSCQGTGACPATAKAAGASCNINQPPNGCCASNLVCSDGVCIPKVGGY